MHILHVLFTASQGGLEQSYIDTTQALTSKGHSVTALLRPDAPYLIAAGAYAKSVETAKPTGFYDLLAAWKIRQLLRRIRPELILAHNARAIALLSMAACGTGIPVVGVSHSYKTARTIRADSLIVLSDHMLQHFIDAGYPTNRLTVIPNLIHLPNKPTLRPRHTPITIGAIGRFTVEKGFDDLLQALHSLKQAGLEFRVRLGGDGEEMPLLKAQAQQLGLAPLITWDGWVKDKAAFYNQIDMACVPSLQESFGLVVIEALAFGVPLVSTDAPGPVSILTDDINALIVPRGDTQAMALAIQCLVAQPEKAAAMVEAGWKRVQAFGFDAVATQWDNVLRASVSGQPSGLAA